MRATGSGAGCGSHWPTCNGQILPQVKANKTLIEFTHRLTSGLSFLFVFIQGFFAFRRFKKGHLVRKAATASMFFMLLEVLIGAALVRLGLVANNASLARAVWVPLHLCNTFLLIGALTVTTWAVSSSPSVFLRHEELSSFLSWENKAEREIAGIRILLLLGMIMTLFVGMTGSVVALGDTLFPVRTIHEGFAQDFSKTAHFLIRLRIWHPIAAIITALFVIYTSQAIARRAGAFVKPITSLVTVLFVTQLALGFLNFALLAPLYLQMLHLLLAQVSWMTLVFLYVYTNRVER